MQSKMILSRLLFAVALVAAAFGWQWATKNYDGLLGTKNLASLMALVVLGTIAVIVYRRHGKYEWDRQAGEKTVMVILTLAAVGTFIWLVSGLTVILGGLIALSLFGLAVLLPDRFHQRGWDFPIRSKVPDWEQIRSDDQPLQDATSGFHDTGIGIFDPSPAS